ncbi:histone H2A-Bbd type 2/3-like [Odocoileus virginianus]|uniref:Histone H2A n=1 Tax=Odocoileus virginianus TaxID=9874 RepID=A0A6J0XB16_ODOVR|nr:histone H2A-Bbd type 2/3-like [Odocoileus virginianus texanus]
MPKKRGRERSSRHRSSTARAELSFSVSHMEHLLLKGRYAQRLSSSAPVFLAAIIQDLTSKVLELAGNEAQNSGQRYITPKMVDMAIHNNALLSSLFRMTTISLEAPGPH